MHASRSVIEALIRTAGRLAPSRAWAPGSWSRLLPHSEEAIMDQEGLEGLDSFTLARIARIERSDAP